MERTRQEDRDHQEGSSFTHEHHIPKLPSSNRLVSIAYPLWKLVVNLGLIVGPNIRANNDYLPDLNSFATASRCQRLAVNTTFQALYWCIVTQWMVLANGVPSKRLPHNKLALIMSDGALQTVQYNRSMCIGIARSVDSQQRWRTQEVHM